MSWWWLLLIPVGIWYLFWFIVVLIGDLRWSIQQLKKYQEKDQWVVIKVISSSFLNAACAPLVILLIGNKGRGRNK